MRKLWVDDCRPAPIGYDWCNTVNESKIMIEGAEFRGEPYELIDVDHDAGTYAIYGGDYIKLLDWLEETGRNYPIRIHSMNAVGITNMKRIIKRNGWMEAPFL